MKSLEQVAENIWLMRFPQRLFGIEIGRNVTVIRLNDGRLVIHSTGPFTAEDLLAIRALGQPAWLLDATLFHDTYAKQGCAAFARIPYLAPRGFREIAGVTTMPLDSPPAEWAGQLDVLPLRGIPRGREHVLFHHASRTLIVADLLLHFPADLGGWSGFFLGYVAGVRGRARIDPIFRMFIKERQAFAESMKRVLEWDIERIVVGHGEPIQTGAKATLLAAVRDAGLADV